MTSIGAQIEAIRKEWGSKLLILGHHYQRSSVIEHVDVTGDSLELARAAAAHTEAERIVFCGVHFMAESADILTAPNQAVYMPETRAGCPMADMATAEDMEAAWRVLQTSSADWVPVVYVNSSAAIKARCGRWGGSACTSSNAPAVFKRILDEGKRVFFLPDEHLGANTAHDLKIHDSEVAVYNPRAEAGGLTPAQLDRSKVVVWKGFCLVHTAFSTRLIRRVRDVLPRAKIIVHPETPKEVVREADAHGSTAFIIKYVAAAPAGSAIVIGTETNLVDRLAEQQRGRLSVKALAPSVCANMAKTNLTNLLEVLQSWPDTCRVRVDEQTAADARLCLERMLAH